MIQIVFKIYHYPDELPSDPAISDPAMDLFFLTCGLKSRYFAFGDWIRGISFVFLISGRGDLSDRSRDFDRGRSRAIFGVLSPFGGAADFTLGVLWPRFWIKVYNL